MCGITGIIAFNEKAKQNFKYVNNSVQSLSLRGPDFQSTYTNKNTCLGHARLSIIDTSNSANQPFTEETNRYTIVFNGEIYNFKQLRKELEEFGFSFHTNSDTEVLLKLYIKYGKRCLQKLNGFFAFCVYDAQTETYFIARDRMGIKPLLYFTDENQFIFGSEMKAILAYQNIKREIDFTALHTYFQLNYIPAPKTIIQGIQKLLPGNFIYIENNHIEIEQYYEIPKTSSPTFADYETTQQQLKQKIDESVKLRLVADVPLGTFLSGGIDSSIITATASKYVDNLNSFSIGYKDEPLFDETQYANIVAKKFKTNHTVFNISNKELYDNLNSILDYIDEPFADSSAIAVNLLCKYTKEKVTVALSGDGADEMFSGYNKHMAEYKVRHGGIASQLIKHGGFVAGLLPQSRNGKLSNLFRQIDRFYVGANLSDAERYWRWASFNSEKEVKKLIKQSLNKTEFSHLKNSYLSHFGNNNSIQDVLYADMHLVLANDMLTKVDLMSMKNSLEVRVPFLDYNLVNFAFNMPIEYKINSQMKKRILQDAYRDILPNELYNRPKHGFEVPLLKCFQTDLKSLICDDLLGEKLIKEQNIFNYSAIEKLKNQLFSSNPKDAHATVWALIVFQTWWKKWILNE